MSESALATKFYAMKFGIKIYLNYGHLGNVSNGTWCPWNYNEANGQGD